MSEPPIQSRQPLKWAVVKCAGHWWVWASLQGNLAPIRKTNGENGWAEWVQAQAPHHDIGKFLTPRVKAKILQIIAAIE